MKNKPLIGSHYVFDLPKNNLLTVINSGVRLTCFLFPKNNLLMRVILWMFHTVDYHAVNKGKCFHFCKLATQNSDSQQFSAIFATWTVHYNPETWWFFWQLHSVPHGWTSGKKRLSSFTWSHIHITCITCYIDYALCINHHSEKCKVVPQRSFGTQL